MRIMLLWLAVAPAMLLTLAPSPAWAQGDGDKDALAKSGELFLEAFHKGNAAALADLWTTDGDITDQTGRHVKGRDAIEKSFKALFAGKKGLKLGITSLSLRFVSPDVAIEDGTTESYAADGTPQGKVRFTIVHAKKDGQWRISSVRQAPLAPTSNYEHLRGLEGIIGKWTTDTPKGEVEKITFAWSDNQNFIAGTFSSAVKNTPLSSAKQTIGWDPAAKTIRSWTFDATGGFGEGAWTRDGNKWTIKTTSVFQDGKKATATFHVRPVDANTLSWQVTDRSVDGNALPDTKELTMKRTK